MSARTKKFRYTGDVSLGERAPYVVGVPSRDLYEDDDSEALKIAEENSLTPGAVFVAVKHRTPEEPAVEPAKKAKEAE